MARRLLRPGVSDRLASPLLRPPVVRSGTLEHECPYALEAEGRQSIDHRRARARSRRFAPSDRWDPGGFVVCANRRALKGQSQLTVAVTSRCTPRLGGSSGPSSVYMRRTSSRPEWTTSAKPLRSRIASISAGSNRLTNGSPTSAA
jgi:hypothetical protein